MFKKLFILVPNGYDYQTGDLLHYTVEAVKYDTGWVYDCLSEEEIKKTIILSGPKKHMIQAAHVCIKFFGIDHFFSHSDHTKMVRHINDKGRGNVARFILEEARLVKAEIVIFVTEQRGVIDLMRYFKHQNLDKGFVSAREKWTQNPFANSYFVGFPTGKTYQKIIKAEMIFE